MSAMVPDALKLMNKIIHDRTAEYRDRIAAARLLIEHSMPKLVAAPDDEQQGGSQNQKLDRIARKMAKAAITKAKAEAEEVTS
jgi:hypothetical protein